MRPGHSQSQSAPASRWGTGRGGTFLCPFCFPPGASVRPLRWLCVPGISGSRCAHPAPGTSASAARLGDAQQLLESRGPQGFPQHGAFHTVGGCLQCEGGLFAGKTPDMPAERLPELPEQVFLSPRAGMEWASGGNRLEVLCSTFRLHFLCSQSCRNRKSRCGEQRAATLSWAGQREGVGGDPLGGQHAGQAEMAPSRPRSLSAHEHVSLASFYGIIIALRREQT